MPTYQGVRPKIRWTPITYGGAATEFEEDFEGFVTSWPGVSATAGQEFPPDTGLDPTDIHSVFGLTGPGANGGGVITLSAVEDLTAPAGSIVGALTFNNSAFTSQYFAGLRAWRDFATVPGRLYTVHLSAKLSWNPSGINGGPASAFVFLPDQSSVGTGFFGEEFFGEWVTCNDMVFRAHASTCRVGVQYAYGNSNWNNTDDNPRTIFFDAIIGTSDGPAPSPPPTYDLEIGFPLFGARSWTAPSPGSQAVLYPSGVDEAWVDEFDAFLEGRVRYIPAEDGTTSYGPATGWNSEGGWQRFLDFARAGNVFEFWRDADDAGSAMDCYLIEPEKEPEIDAGLFRALTLRLRSADNSRFAGY
jgi:hypothetical protein